MDTEKWHLYMRKYNPALKENAFESFLGKQVHPETVMLSEINQLSKLKNCMCMCQCKCSLLG